MQVFYPGLHCKFNLEQLCWVFADPVTYAYFCEARVHMLAYVLFYQMTITYRDKKKANLMMIKSV